MSSADPILNGIEAQTFNLVRKGFDPDEVRTYLLQVSVAVSGLRAEAAATVAPPSSPPALLAEVPDDEAMAAARAELSRLRADQAAVKAWFGEDGRATTAQVPGLVRDAAATADALVRAAEEQAATLVPVPVADPFASVAPPIEPDPVVEPVVADVPPRGWEELGGSVARMLASAEDEANGIRTAAEATAAVTREEAESIRARADETLTQAERHAADTVAQADQQASETLAEADLHASDVVARAERAAADTTAAAESRAAALQRAAEAGARAHIAEVLAQAETDLDRTRRELDAAHVHLSDIHASVTQSLAARAPRPELDDLEATYAAALSVADAAPDEPPVAAADTTPGLGVEPTPSDQAPYAHAVVDTPPAPAAPPLPAPAEVDPTVGDPTVGDPFPSVATAKAPAPAPAETGAPADPFARIAESAATRPADPFAGVESFAPPRTVEASVGAGEAEGSVRGILADRSPEPDEDATWSPRRTFGERLGLSQPDDEASSGWEPPAPPPPPGR